MQNSDTYFSCPLAFELKNFILNTMKKIGIIGAMESEIELLKTYFEGKIYKRAGLSVYDGTIFNKPVVFARAGIGKVNAAICTQVLISNFGAELIINCGIAGAISKELSVLDIVISEKAFQHDVDATYFGYKLGQIPDISGIFWKADTTLIKRTKAAFKKLADGNFDFDNKSIFKNKDTLHKDFSACKMLTGAIATGDVFVTADSHRSRIKSICPATACVEMEGAAIAQVASANAVPFLILRSISDSADETVEQLSYEEFAARAENMAASIILQLVYDF